MVLFVVYRESVETEYRTSICSKATALIFFINFLMFTIPFLFAYNTQGFWLKSNSYDEQPDIHFIYEYFVMIETDDIENPVICTTLDPIVSSMEDFNHCPVIKAREEDFNKDGKYDKLFFEVESLVGTKSVYEVTVVLLFDYKLTSHSWFQMQTLGWIELGSALGGGRLDATGDLRLRQRALLGHKGRDFRFNTSVVTAQFPHEFSLFKLLSSFTERNVTTRIDNVYSVWNRARDPDDPFVFTLELNYPEETVRYRPGTWQVVKIAWLQYLALFYLSVLLGRKLKHFILDNRLVNNVRCYPWKKLI